MISDHAIVDITLAISKPGLPKKKITYRKYRTIYITQLHTEILEFVLVISAYSTLDNLIEQYNVWLTHLMDKHGPVRSKVFNERPITPWHNSDIAEAKT